MRYEYWLGLRKDMSLFYELWKTERGAVVNQFWPETCSKGDLGLLVSSNLKPTSCRDRHKGCSLNKEPQIQLYSHLL